MLVKPSKSYGSYGFSGASPSSWLPSTQHAPRPRLGIFLHLQVDPLRLEPLELFPLAGMDHPGPDLTWWKAPWIDDGFLCDCNFFCLQTHRRNHRDHPTEFIFFSANHHNHHRLSSMAPFITSQSLATLVCLTNCTSFEATNFFSDGLQQLKIKITHSPLTIFLGFPHGNCPSHFASYLVYCLYSSSNLTCPIY